MVYNLGDIEEGTRMGQRWRGHGSGTDKAINSKSERLDRAGCFPSTVGLIPWVELRCLISFSISFGLR